MNTANTATVLLIDDGLAERKLFAMAGKKAGVGYSLQEASDGFEAINYLKGEGAFADRGAHPFPSLIILDVNMPGLSGFEVLEWIRGHPVCRNLPVVMWTSSSSDDDLRRAYALAANSYLVKPLSLALLVEMVRAVEDYWLKWNRVPRLEAADARVAEAAGLNPAAF